jgi:hypothetical protein
MRSPANPARNRLEKEGKFNFSINRPYHEHSDYKFCCKSSKGRAEIRITGNKINIGNDIKNRAAEIYACQAFLLSDGNNDIAEKRTQKNKS